MFVFLYQLVVLQFFFKHSYENSLLALPKKLDELIIHPIIQGFLEFFLLMSVYWLLLQVLVLHFLQCFHQVLKHHGFLQPSGFSTLLIQVVDTSANMFSISSRLVMLSLKPSFLSPLYCLYSFVDIQDHAFEISFVNNEYQIPSLTPTIFHSEVSFFLVSIPLIL